MAEVRAATADREGPYQFDELMRSVPHVLIPQENWKVTASHTAPIRIGGTASPLSAFNFEGWTTGDRQEEGMWFEIELPKPATLTEIQFTAPPISRGRRPGSPPPIHTYPRAYEVKVSADGKNWKAPVAAGQCDEPDNVIAFQPVKAKFLRITQTATLSDEEEENTPWSMKELKVLGLVDNGVVQ